MDTNPYPGLTPMATPIVIGGISIAILLLLAYCYIQLIGRLDERKEARTYGFSGDEIGRMLKARQQRTWRLDQEFAEQETLA